MLQGQWSGCVWPASDNAIRNPDTGVNIDLLKQVVTASVKVPEGFVSDVTLDIHKRMLQF